MSWGLRGKSEPSLQVAAFGVRGNRVHLQGTAIVCLQLCRLQTITPMAFDGFVC